MRKCWNWQTGMTKDHVSDRRVGSSPIFRITVKGLEFQDFFLLKNCVPVSDSVTVQNDKPLLKFLFEALLKNVTAHIPVNVKTSVLTR